MNESWYYVQNGERLGPVAQEEIKSKLASSTLGPNDYVWSKGMENWTKIKDIAELAGSNGSIGANELDFRNIPRHKKNLYIKVGMDRGMTNELEYGPFSLDGLKKLFQEKRINERTFFFQAGGLDWLPLGSVDGFAEIFGVAKVEAVQSERRSSPRRPFVARMLIQNRDSVYEGICRDISIGGMQVLVDSFPCDIGEHININVHPENTDYHFVASGVVVRLLEGQQGFSFRFQALAPKAKEAIENYLSHG